MTASLKPLDPAAGQGGPPRHDAQDHRDRAGREVQRVDLRRSGAGPDGPRPCRRQIRFSMTNRSDEAVPGVRLTAAPMMHSMDFHAAMVSPQDKYRSIAPGQTIEFEFTVELPGRVHVPLRHADDPRAHRLGDVWRGDRRAPRRLPDQGRSRVRHHPERVLRQARSRAAARSDGAPLYVLDGDRLRAAQPTLHACSMACTTGW